LKFLEIRQLLKGKKKMNEKDFFKIVKLQIKANIKKSSKYEVK
jgi:hypothetical protein